jgi:large subunit ribosomal protein L24
MKMEFSTAWKGSKKPRKQRNYVRNAPLHIKGSFLHSPVSKDLQKTMKIKTIRVKKGDKVKVTRGQFKGVVGLVEKVNTRSSRVYVAKAELVKKDGSKVKYPLHASKVEIVEFEQKGKRRV